MEGHIKLYGIISFLIFTSTVFTSGNCPLCDDSSEVNAATCAILSKDVENALLGDEGNLFSHEKSLLLLTNSLTSLIEGDVQSKFWEELH